MSVKILYLSKNNEETEIQSAFQFFFRQNSNKYSVKIISAATIDGVNLSVDLIIAESNSAFPLLQKKPDFFNIPLLFCCLGNEVDQLPPLLPNLFGICCFSSDTDLRGWGIPSKLIYNFRLPVSPCIGKTVEQSSRKPGDPLKAIYFPSKDVHLNTLRDLIETVNPCPDISLTIYNPENKYEALLSFLNRNITLSSMEMINLDSFHVIIGSGQNILNGLAAGKICIVLGNNGFGGMVDPSNYEILQQFGFFGRPGGTRHEYIPNNLLQVVFHKIIHLKDFKFSEQLKKQVLNDYSAERFWEKIGKLIDGIIQLSRKIKNRNSLVQLCPATGDNFIAKEKFSYTVRGAINSFLTKIDKDTLDLIYKCEGRITVSEIMKQEDYSEESLGVFAENVMELWNNKLITLHLQD
jgi:hypothetical protein